MSVQVHVSSGSQGALTSLNGRYVIRGLPPGVHDVTAQNIGYGTRTVTESRYGRVRPRSWTSP